MPATESETSAGGCAWRTARTSRRQSKTALWKGYSLEGLWRPTISPFFFTQTMSAGVSEPLSMPLGLIHMSPLSSRMEMLPPLVVVMPRSYTRFMNSTICSLG